MGGNGNKSEPPKQDNDKPKNPQRPQKPPVEDDDFEDGDFATPKRDRYDSDDEPL